MPLRRPDCGQDLLGLLCELGFAASVFQGPLRARGEEVLRLALRADLTDQDIDTLRTALVSCRDQLHFTS